MPTPRTALRTAAALGAATALTLAGTAAASATTAESTTTGNTVTVDFALESGQVGDTCGAALVPPTAGAELFAGLNPAGGVDGILTAIDALDGVTVLKKGMASAVVMTLVTPTDSVTATDVPSGLYGLVTVCLSDMANPGIEPLLVGDPLEAALGSLGGMSSATGEGETEGIGGIGMDTLSSALGGEAGAELDLNVLSSGLGATEN